jgi:quercetin dioxygenase-like cupin family protein
MGWHRTPLALAAFVLAIAVPTLDGAGSQTGTPAAETPDVSSQVFAEASPVAIEDPILAIAVVRVEPGGAIAPHVHSGTQLGTIAAGELTYTVLSDHVTIVRAREGADRPEDRVDAGETVVLGTGDAVIETPGAAHRARNDGDETVVIWLSTHFPAGAPRSEPAPAAPVQ